MSVRKEVWKKKDDQGNPVTSTGYRVEFYLELPSAEVVHVRKASTSWTRREAERWEQQKRVELLSPKTLQRFLTSSWSASCIATSRPTDSPPTQRNGPGSTGPRHRGVRSAAESCPRGPLALGWRQVLPVRPEVGDGKDAGTVSTASSSPDEACAITGSASKPVAG